MIFELIAWLGLWGIIGIILICVGIVLLYLYSQDNKQTLFTALVSIFILTIGTLLILKTIS